MHYREEINVKLNLMTICYPPYHMYKAMTFGYGYLDYPNADIDWSVLLNIHIFSPPQEEETTESSTLELFHNPKTIKITII